VKHEVLEHLEHFEHFEHLDHLEHLFKRPSSSSAEESP
jgi:hypothetical protein